VNPLYLSRDKYQRGRDRGLLGGRAVKFLAAPALALMALTTTASANLYRCHLKDAVQLQDDGTLDRSTTVDGRHYSPVKMKFPAELRRLDRSVLCGHVEATSTPIAGDAQMPDPVARLQFARDEIVTRV
jgi:hypothetical protein